MNSTDNLVAVPDVDYLLVKQTDGARARLADVPDGEWTQEPDKAHWIDPATDLDCLIVRGPTGALCGYVAVPPSHPWYGKGYSECLAGCPEDDYCYDHSPGAQVEVHGGLTYAEFCAEGMEDGICHVPADGRPDKVWWFGFDCAHYMDLSPRDFDPKYQWRTDEGYYRDFAYVTDTVRNLARQIATVTS